MRSWRLIALLTVLSGCTTAPAGTAEYWLAYDRASMLERTNHPLLAAGAYAEAAEVASRPRRRVHASYRQARQLEVGGERERAVAMYLAIAEEEPEGEMAPRCLYYAGRMAFEDGAVDVGLARMRQVIETYPHNGMAPRAIQRSAHQLVERDGPDGALTFLRELELSMRGTDVGDNLLYEQALIEDDRGRWQEALTLFEQLAVQYTYPHSTLYDDTMWRAGNIATEHGEHQRAVAYLEALVSHREDSLATGSYSTDWTDDAQLLIGRILEEHLADPRGALRAYELLATFPDSVLADDGLYRAAGVHRAQGRTRRSCRTLRRLLRDFPYSNRQRQARQLYAEIDCDEG